MLKSVSGSYFSFDFVFVFADLFLPSLFDDFRFGESIMNFCGEGV